MPVECTIELFKRQLANLNGSGRKLVAIAGPPGSGKSTLAEELSDCFNREQSGVCQIIPMDGWHYDNAVLAQLGLESRKGSPDSFDVRGMINLLKRLQQNQSDIAVPVFDRDLDVSRGSARLILQKTDILLVEGNYLLLDQTGWRDMRQLFDLTFMLKVPIEVLRQRLMARWAQLPAGEAQQKVAANDLPNARLVAETSLPADLTVPYRP